MRIIAAVTLIFLPGTFTAVSKTKISAILRANSHSGALRGRLLQPRTQGPIAGRFVLDVAVLGDNNSFNICCAPRLVDHIQASPSTYAKSAGR